MPSERSDSSGGHGHRTPDAGKMVTRRFISDPATINDSDAISNTKHEEWTTSKKVVNHKTRQTETRVQRQLVLEDGKVVADTGPQITTRTTVDNKMEESEDTQHKKSGDDSVPDGYVPVPGSERVVCEKTESHQVMKETKEENMKMHDENYKELRGPEEIHRMAVMVPNESPLVGIGRFPGKLTHYSSRSKKVTDKDEVKEISEKKNGEVTTQTTRTHHHEEMDDDEVPEDEAEGKDLPAVERETKRNFEYLHDGADIKVPDRMRKQKDLLYLQATSPERHDPVTRKALSVEEEEEIRNSVTNRWLEDHFGSDTSDEDAHRPKHGGNVINIKMTDVKRTPSPPLKEARDSPSPIYAKPYLKTPSPAPSPKPFADSTLQSNKSYQNVSYYREQKSDESHRNRAPLGSNWKSSPSLYHNIDRASPRTRGVDSYRDIENSYRPVEKSFIVDNNIFTKEDRKLNDSRRVVSEYSRKTDSSFQESAKPAQRPVQRSQSSRVVEKHVQSGAPLWSAYTLPRDPGAHRTTTRVERSTTKTSRGVQADLEDEPIVPMARHTVHAVRETQSLPRHRHTHGSHHHHRHRTHEEHTHSRHRDKSPVESNFSTASRPSKTFYFGDKTDTSYNSPRHRDNYFNTIEKDRYVQPPRRFRSDRDRYYSVEDLATRSYSATPTSKKPSFIDRQRYFPATPPVSPPPRLIKMTNGRSTSPSPPESPRPSGLLLPPPSPYASLQRRSASPVVDLPSFTPLQSPVEIKQSLSSRYTTRQRRSDTPVEYYSSSKPAGDKSGYKKSSSAQAGDWGSR
uniref:Putative conserved proteinconserved protein n=1 Tax=Ixodes ricinus TaxID=34613 RepID=A0A147BTN0_IXORI